MLPLTSLTRVSRQSELETRRPVVKTAKKAEKKRNKKTRNKKKLKQKQKQKQKQKRAGGVDVDVDAQPDLEELREMMVPGRDARTSRATTKGDAHALARTGHVVMGACRSVIDERLDELAEAVYSRARTLPKACLLARNAAEDADGRCSALAVDVARSFCESTPRSCAPEIAPHEL